MYEGRSISSRTALLNKHTVTAENQNYYEVVLPLMYVTYHGLIFDLRYK